jgi:hypothetical protein
MKNSRTLAFFALVACFVLCASARTNAQSATGFTDVSYDDFTNTVTAYAETDTDYDIGGDYIAYVSLIVKDDSNNIIASGSQRDDAGYGFAAVTLQFAGSPDTTYTGIGTHRLYAYFYDDYWDYGYYPYRHIYDYYDNWYFGYFSGLGIDYPWYYYFYSPGYAFRSRRTRPISLGTTHSSDSATTPGVSINISPSQTVKDGATASLSVTVNGDTPSAYQWSYKAPNGSANNPKVTFSDATSNSTSVTSAHWFANPDNPCSASLDAPYTISCAITLSSGKKKTVKTTLVVNAYWFPAGQVDPNEATIAGAPGQSVDENGIWHVNGMGTLRRVIPTKHVFIPSTSQFFGKADAHEQAHVDHWNVGQLFGALFQPEDFFNRVKDFTAASQGELIDKITAETNKYIDEQRDLYNHAEDERQAYAVSDAIDPKYLYQFCGSNQL